MKWRRCFQTRSIWVQFESPLDSDVMIEKNIDCYFLGVSMNDKDWVIHAKLIAAIRYWLRSDPKEYKARIK